MTDTTAALPCRIHLRNGGEFVVENVGSWSYIPQGIYASGYFDSSPARAADVVIPEDAVDYIEFEYEALTSLILPVGPTDAD